MLAVVIRHWSVKNFKSIGHANLSLAPLTLFAGANSSGKRIRAAAPGKVSLNTVVITNVPFGVDDDVVMLRVPDE